MCLTLVVAETGQALREPAAEEILDAIRSLPPHPDVVPALGQLNDAGLRCVALTNSPPETAHAQLRNAGLERYFAKVMSVEDSRRLKPARVVYRSAGLRLGRSAEELVMVAAHTWDLAGAGGRTALVSREGRPPHPLYPVPDIIGADLGAVTGRLCNG